MGRAFKVAGNSFCRGQAAGMMTRTGGGLGARGKTKGKSLFFVFPRRVEKCWTSLKDEILVSLRVAPSVAVCVRASGGHSTATRPVNLTVPARARAP
jgi:hypothetical protein